MIKKIVYLDNLDNYILLIVMTFFCFIIENFDDKKSWKLANASVYFFWLLENK